MITIWKFPVGLDGITQVPYGSRIRKVGLQDNQLMVWCEVSTDTLMHETLRITAYATGQPLDLTKHQKYLDTVFTTNGLVWHIFVDKDRSNPGVTLDSLREFHAS